MLNFLLNIYYSGGPTDLIYNEVDVATLALDITL